MGVQGLWQLLSSTGKPVSLESLEGKILAVDVSVWLHQLSKGMRDSDGNPLPHAHLHGLFTRICKLLYYRIKPVFVFDGGVPALKKQTLASRREKRDDAEKESTKLQQKLLTNLIRSQAVKEALGLDKAPKLPSVPKKSSRDAVFELPPLSESSERYLKENKDLDEAFQERRELQQLIEDQYDDLNSIDVESEEFKSLPPDIQHEIIMDMKERRKNFKMSRRTELPEDSKDFSKFQVTKLLKHSKLTVRLDGLRKELNTKTSEVSKHLGESLYDKDVWTHRVISSDTSHSVLIKGMRDKGKSVNELKETDSYPTISEESSNSDELLCDSGTEERASMNFLRPNQLKNGEGGKGCDVTDKPVYRPIIEVDTDSESSDEVDTDFAIEPVHSTVASSKPDSKSRGDNDLVRGELPRDVMSLIPTTVNEDNDNNVIMVDDSDLMDDVQANRDLQLAIEKSIQDQIKKVSEGSVELPKETNNLNTVSTNGKSIFDKQISNRSILSEDWSSLDEEQETNSKKDNKNMTQSAKGQVRDILMKQASNVSSMSNESEEILESNEMGRDVRTQKLPIKRKSSNELSESKKRKIDVVSSRKENETLSGDEASDSEDDFLEVKFNPGSVKEDELFPASMFEPFPMNSISSRYEKTEIIEVQEKDSTKDDRTQQKNIIDAQINEKSTVHSLESHNSSMEDRGPNVSDIVGKHVSEHANDKTHDMSGSETKKEALKVCEAAESHESEEMPDVIETRRSSSSVSSLPDVVESPDTDSPQDRTTSQESPRVVPDLVKDYQNLDFQTLTGMRDNLAAESESLRQERGRQERLATSINDQMHAEAQELLRLFGIPYIVSPTEAEAQCAQLDILNLTQGTITDDSDIWLFGGTHVYRNFFNQQKHVEYYRSDNIKTQLGLTREKLINLALLCGSDYTEGIQGVGPVTAMEILLEFPGDGLEGLLALKSWWESAQQQYVKPKESKLKTKIRDLEISLGFPSRQVVDAYLSPTVDDSAEIFSWGSPDTDGLKQYISIKLGWTSEKVDEHLQPVLKRLQEKKSQRRISSFFQPENYIEPAKMKSKRLQKVVNKLLNPKETTEESEEQTDNISEQATTAQQKKRGRKAKGQIDNVNIDIHGMGSDETIGQKDSISGNKSRRGKSRGRGRCQSQRGRSKRSDKESKDSRKNLRSSESSGSSSEDSVSDSLSSNSDSDIEVVESGLNIAEILSMSGFTDLDAGVDDGMKVDNDLQEQITEKYENAKESDENVSDSELFKNEGGFIREGMDESVRSIKPQRTEIMQDIMKQLNQAKSKYFESELSQEEVSDIEEKSKYFAGENPQVPNETSSITTKEVNNVSENSSMHVDIKKHKRTTANDSTELSANAEKVRNERYDLNDKDVIVRFSELPSRKIDYNKKIENTLQESRKDLDVKPCVSGQAKMKERKTRSKLLNRISSQETGVKSDESELKEEKQQQPIDIACEIDKKDKDVSNTSREKVSAEVDAKTASNKEKIVTKMESGDYYTSDPVHQLVTGVPWAGKKGKTKGGSKGKTRLKGRKMEPVEKIVRKRTRSAKGSKSVVGVVNLSESDTDSDM